MAEPPPQVSPDGKFYWDGIRWVPLPTQTIQAQSPQAPLPPPVSHRLRNGCIGLVVLVLLFTAIGVCGNGSRGGNTTTPSDSPSPAGPSPVAVHFSGKGSKVISPVQLEAARYRVTWTARGGTDNFIVTLHGQDDTLLVNEIPPKPASGETFP